MRIKWDNTCLAWHLVPSKSSIKVLCECVFMSFYLCLVRRVCVFVCDWVSRHAFVCICMCPCVLVRESLGVALRGSGLLAHSNLPAVGSKYWYPVRVPYVVGVVHPAKHHQAAILPPADKRRKRGFVGGE